MSVLNRTREIIQAFRHNNVGASAVEFAIIASFMSIILLNIVDIAMFMYKKMEVTGAVRAGAQYALVNTTTATPALIAGVVTDSTTIATMTVDVDDNLCGCSDGTTFTCGASTCGAGTTGRTHSYTTIDASHTHTWIFYPGTIDITASAQIRTN